MAQNRLRTAPVRTDRSGPPLCRASCFGLTHAAGSGRALPLLALACLAASCSTLKPQREDPVGSIAPRHFSTPSGGEAQSLTWWTAFGSEQLDALIAEAFEGNLTLEQAAARLDQAAALARKSGAARSLQLDGRVDAATRSAERDGARTDVQDYSLGLFARYELDLWGRLKSAEQAAMTAYRATAFDLQSAAMSLSAQLAQTYFRWQAQCEALALYESQLRSNRNKLEALERRYRAGQATSLALLQQRQQVAASEARIPPVKAVIETSENSIAVLTGHAPGNGPELRITPLPGLPPVPDAGLPINLLETRPDVQAARLRLESADWNVGAARAARLPSLSLTGSLTTSGDDIDKLFNDWAANLAASLLAPLLDGGARRAEVDRATGVSRERIAAYRLAVLEAIRETEDALSGERHQADYVEALGRQYAAAQKSEAESIRRYQRGILPFLDALTAIVLRENLEINYVQARADLLANRVQLYRALGGDWTFILEQKQ